MSNETVVDGLLRESFELSQRVHKLEIKAGIQSKENDNCEINKTGKGRPYNLFIFNGHYLWWCYKHNKPLAYCEKKKLQKKINSTVDVEPTVSVEKLKCVECGVPLYPIDIIHRSDGPDIMCTNCYGKLIADTI